MKYVGIDLHKKTIVCCVVNRQRKVLSRRTLSCPETENIVAFFRSLGRFQAVVEATASYQWLFDLLEPLAKRLVLAHPGKLRVIAESVRKSDKVDAEALAEFLALDMVPTAYRPTVRQREHRVLIRHRVHLQQRLTSVKCRIRRVLANHNADHGDDPFTKAGLAALATAQVTPQERFVLDELIAEFGFLKLKLKEAERRIAEFAKDATPDEARARDLMQSIPGVGKVTAEVVLAELADPARFGSIKKAASYAGLAPGRRESAGKAKDLPITKQGSRLLRWCLVEAAWQLVRYEASWKTSYEMLKRRRGAKRAIIAIARRLLGMMLTMVRTDKAFDPDHQNQAPKAPPPKAPTERKVIHDRRERAQRRQAARRRRPASSHAFTAIGPDFVF